MRLSILDQAPISSHQTPKVALQESMKLAQVGEKYGYTRYWIAEHHDLSGLACSAPEVMLSYIGANTSSIRIGSGAVLLPHYKPYKVAEVYNMLATLFPGRIDVGIGRAQVAQLKQPMLCRIIFCNRYGGCLLRSRNS
ncbi:luciferase family oxidoreductase group 1 [Bacillus luteolus]|nr:luciferase family oxidoreductase group 1 [Cytobacillus luteolus]